MSFVNFIPGLERIVPDDALLLLGHVPPGERVGEVHQCFGVEQAKAETAVDHQARSIPLPARVVGQGIELGGPDHDVLQIPPGEIRAEGTRRRETVNTPWDRNLLW